MTRYDSLLSWTLAEVRKQTEQCQLARLRDAVTTLQASVCVLQTKFDKQASKVKALERGPDETSLMETIKALKAKLDAQCRMMEVIKFRVQCILSALVNDVSDELQRQ